jgi:hypothetical protein
MNKGMPSKSQSSPLSNPLAPETKEANKLPNSFSLEHELRKIKILVPLTKLLKNKPFKKSMMKVLQPTPSSVSSDDISLHDENPTITVGPHIEDGCDASPPFYISMNVHDKILHNCLMDSRASHNVMPKVFMEELGLDITKPYQDMYSFDSKKVKCLGLIKDMVVSLAQLTMKSVVMDIVVADKFMVIYLDDITIFSKFDEEHLQHLEQVFKKCRRYGISLNPKKSHFCMPEGKLLGHIISAGGIKVDPKRVCAIQQIDIPRNKKDVQSFIGKINFLRRFVLNFVEILKPITNMLKKDAVIKWSLEEKSSFQTIKQDLVEAPVLAIPDYAKYFFIFSFASEETIVVVLLQKNEEGHE